MDWLDSAFNLQKAVCERFGAEFHPPFEKTISGVSVDCFNNTYPFNGMRCVPGPGENGWYFWCGEELGQGDDFFQPMHVFHVADARPEIAKFLALPPGWRFLVAMDYEDVWFDASLLEG